MDRAHQRAARRRRGVYAAARRRAWSGARQPAAGCAPTVRDPTDAANAIESILTVITKSLKKGQPITFVGFGTFKTAQRKARMARNPQTGAAIKTLHVGDSIVCVRAGAPAKEDFVPMMPSFDFNFSDTETQTQTSKEST